MNRPLLRWLPWLLLVAVAASALAVGAVRAGGHESLDSKVMHIAGEVRCPVCEGQSAAQSQAAASLQIRDQIRQDVASGQSESRILAQLVRAYGPGILEKPEASGVSLVVWVVPVLAFVAGLGGLGWDFRRWRSRVAPAPTVWTTRIDVWWTPSSPDRETDRSIHRRIRLSRGRGTRWGRRRRPPGERGGRQRRQGTARAGTRLLPPLDS